MNFKLEKKQARIEMVERICSWKWIWINMIVVVLGGKRMHGILFVFFRWQSSLNFQVGTLSFGFKFSSGSSRKLRKFHEVCSKIWVFKVLKLKKVTILANTDRSARSRWLNFGMMLSRRDGWGPEEAEGGLNWTLTFSNSILFSFFYLFEFSLHPLFDFIVRKKCHYQKILHNTFGMAKRGEIIG